MQNKVDNRTTGVPGLSRLPLLGKLFSHETRETEKTELLIFLRPTVIDNTNRITTAGAAADVSESPDSSAHLIPDKINTDGLSEGQ